MYKKLNLQQLKDTYSLELARYLKQEKWLEENPSKATISVNGKIPLELFEVTISNLGLIGYEMEDRFNYYQTTK